MAQRAEVERLASEGAAIRAIAKRVFGDARYRGRVERILRRVPASTAASPPTSTSGAGRQEAVPAVEATAAIRAAFDRRIAEIATGGIDPSLGELRALLDVQRRLETREQLERLNALTRAPRRPEL